MSSDNRAYIAFQERFRSIEGLYGMLYEMVMNVCMEDGKLILTYHSDVLVIEKHPKGFLLHLNGKKLRGVWKGGRTYSYALAFVNEYRKDSYLEIDDSQIINADQNGLTYLGKDGRKHVIDYALCAQNYAKSHPGAEKCVGEEDYKDRFFLLYTDVLPVKVIFWLPRIWRWKKRLFKGAEDARFEALKKRILDSGFTLYDPYTVLKNCVFIRQ